MKIINDEMIKNKCDILIIGSGIAGLFTALNIDPSYSVHVITKNQLNQNNSALAQGGIVCCIDPKVHYEDTMRAGRYHNNEEAVKLLGREGDQAIQKLIEYGVNFDRNADGTLRMTREGGHRQWQVAHAKDETGKEIIRALSDLINQRSNIKVKERVFAIDIIEEKGVAKGIKLLADGKKQIYESKVTILATGGIGHLYEGTTNEIGSTGDGIAMAYRAKVNIKDMEFVQFHPTALYSKSKGKKLLISEAVRGEGGILKNINGEAFMEKYHKMKDLAPRDIVAQCIFNEINVTGTPFVYLDVTHLSKEFIQSRFPMIYKICRLEKIDISKDWIPVAPVAHYVMGGIETDYQGRTTVENLYACGECACTGVHGANRLASNSLLEGVVFGNRVAEDINNRLKKANFEQTLIKHKGCYLNTKYMKLNYDQNEILHTAELQKIEDKLKQIMSQYVSIVREEKGLLKAMNIIGEIKERLQQNSNDTIQYYQLINQMTLCRIIIEGALKRKKSLGAHYRIEDDIERGVY